jgi:YfiH family protein
MKTPENMLTFNFPALPPSLKREAPRAYLTLASMPSMRFRPQEQNPARDSFFASFCPQKYPMPLLLAHSRQVFALDSPDSLARTGDGIITTNPALVPVVTVADCMPIYMWDSVTGCFGVLHSGWRGTGIVIKALELASSTFAAQSHNFRIILGPHIQGCCYTVEEDRAAFFAKTFTAECVTKDREGKWRLSLAKANLELLKKAGVPPAHILCQRECTCCDTRFGSFRRQTARLPGDMPLEEKSRHFTAMAAFAAHSREAP